MKKSLVNALLFLFITTNIIAQSVSKTMKRLPDTGQTASYTNTFGEDADYNFNAPAFILGGNGTVKDTVTTLMWQKTDGGEMTIENAIIYADTLTLGGYTDWRLPNCHELFSILNHGRANPAINTTYFTPTLAEYWWSSQRQANDATKIWVTNSGGGVGNHPKTETTSAGGNKKFHVRAVRDVVAPTVLANHFVNNGDGTTTDLLTNLVWQQIPSADSLTWEQALTLADTSTYANFTNWRMPNIKELQSINEERLVNPSMNTAFFSGVNANQYWSSTSLPNQTTRAWYLDTHFGITTYKTKTNRLYLLCVRENNVITSVNKSSFIPNKISVFPNPSNGKVNIESENAIDELKITDLSGQVIVQLSPKAKSITLNLSNDGIYFVTISCAEQVTTQKILIGNAQ